MKLIIDASMALAWLFERQDEKEAVCADQALLAVADAEVVLVPSLWHTEVSNAILIAERRRIISEAQVVDFLTRLSALPFETDTVTVQSQRDSVIALAREHQLTAYDAVYLNLALRVNAVLASFDKALVTAMCRAGGTVFGNL